MTTLELLGHICTIISLTSLGGALALLVKDWYRHGVEK